MKTVALFFLHGAFLVALTICFRVVSAEQPPYYDAYEFVDKAWGARGSQTVPLCITICMVLHLAISWASGWVRKQNDY